MTVEVSMQYVSMIDASMPHMKTNDSLETMKPFAHDQSIWYEW